MLICATSSNQGVFLRGDQAAKLRRVFLSKASICKVFHRISSNQRTVKPETLTSGNFDEFGESGSNRQT